MENSLFLGVPILKHITVCAMACQSCMGRTVGRMHQLQKRIIIMIAGVGVVEHVAEVDLFHLLSSVKKGSCQLLAKVCARSTG